MSVTNGDSSLSYIRKQGRRSQRGRFVLPWLWCQQPSNTGTLDQGGWWPPCGLLVTSASITWRTPLSRQAASKFLPLTTEAVVLATKSLQIPTIHPQGFFPVFELRQTMILFSNPTTPTKLPHNSPYTFFGVGCFPGRWALALRWVGSKTSTNVRAKGQKNGDRGRDGDKKNKTI